MGELSSEMLEMVISGEENTYTIKSDVSDEVFNILYDYLISAILPEINLNNIFGLYELSQEFGLQEIKNLIEKKRRELQEHEEYFENQNIQETQQLHLYDKINDLENQLQNQKIEFQNKLDEQEIRIKHYCEELINEKFQELNEKIDLLQENTNDSLSMLNQNHLSYEEKLMSQTIYNNDNNNEISQIKNQLESLINQCSIQSAQILRNENEINSKFTEMNLIFNEQNNKIDEIKNKYITKDQVRNALNEGLKATFPWSWHEVRKPVASTWKIAMDAVPK